MNSSKEWQQLDEDLNKILEVALAKAVEDQHNDSNHLQHGKGTIQHTGKEDHEPKGEVAELKGEGDKEAEERDQDPHQAVQECCGREERGN